MLEALSSKFWFSPTGDGNSGSVWSGWSEREILLQFYAATGGPEGMWEDTSNWGSELPLEEWYGVFVDGNRKVESLILGGNGLQGVVPACLGGLTNLTALDLIGNRLSGTIPPVLGSLANLDFLNLSRNQLTGAIPAELTKLTRLRVLYLNHNQLTGTVPEGLGELPRLEVLHLAHNQLQALSSQKWCRISELDFLPQRTVGGT